MNHIETDNKNGIERERLNSLINSMNDGVVAVDEQTNIVLYNGATLNILDLNNIAIGDKLGKYLKIIDKNNETINLDDLILNTKTPTINRDYLMEYSDGSKINLFISIAPVRLGFGENGMKGFVILLRDITREKSLEEERDEFISVVSHELRTPIAIAEGNISNAEFIFDKSQDSSQIKTALKQAHDQINFLSGLINDLATLSRAERGILSINAESINVHELLQDISGAYEDEVTKKGLKLIVIPSADLSLLYSSPLYVKEILQNFITNAIKYTESGRITITASYNQSRDGVLFEIADTGIGISKSDVTRIFDKFFRSEDFRTRKNKGTGLGLYVTRKLIKLIGATVDVQSQLNEGSVFRIFIPNIKKQ